jgi:hypothetical protein
MFFQILVGAGCGFFNGTLTLLVPFALEKRDLGTLNSISNYLTYTNDDYKALGKLLYAV